MSESNNCDKSLSLHMTELEPIWTTYAVAILVSSSTLVILSGFLLFKVQYGKEYDFAKKMTTCVFIYSIASLINLALVPSLLAAEKE